MPDQRAPDQPEPGQRMPGEFEPHQRTLMSWPCRRSIWDPHLDEAEAVYAEIASAIAGFEPVTMFAPPDVGRSRRGEVRAGRRDRRDAARRLVGPRQRADLRHGRRWSARPRLPIQRVGREVPTVGRRRCAPPPLDRTHRTTAPHGRPRPRRRLDQHRRGRHARHHRAVPPPSVAQPVDDTSGDRRGALSGARRRDGAVAPERTRPRRAHGRSRGQRGGVHRARPPAAPVVFGSRRAGPRADGGQPRPRGEQRWTAGAGRSNSSRYPCCRSPTCTASASWCPT